MEWIDLSPWMRPLLAASIAVVLALVAHRIGRAIVRRVLRFSVVLTAMEQRIERPSAFAMPLVATQAVFHATPATVPFIEGVRHVNGILLIAALTWLIMSAIGGLAEGVIRKHPADTEDNLAARSIQTQARVLSRTAMGLVLMAGIAFVLMTFPGARQLGASLLASAGVVGLVAGIAARSVFSNLIAGLQIALAQPIRIDDVLIVEGEWGRVEEITSTYVVLRIWDERRLIIPLQWFIENPFQNWTRTGSQIIGTVFLWVDYDMPLAPLREAAQKACEASPDWDGRLCKLQVTEAGERAMQLRVLVTSASSGQNWDLRCAVREALIDFIRREHPQSLPRLRAELGEPPAPFDERPAPSPA
ncbi:mechanosensitive ion channel family protein [Ramlibacter rhizophilus]|uniref:Mechanosensitive ion channel n=1 Tax=Ramlibacter rhizophilus TaxID=1781167 RepID=A0A4Z0C032_9BURK|nr:mechanosensitive ion channel domain-containing protein [Ramlibacter rhizophilus]TFZ04957.1 mechanosensitive ion channel [Ramlibacter rhizophilus]